MVELAWLCNVEKPLPGSIMVGVGSRMLRGDRERLDSKWSILDAVLGLLLLLLVKMGYSSSDTRLVAADYIWRRVRRCIERHLCASLPVFHKRPYEWDESSAACTYQSVSCNSILCRYPTSTYAKVSLLVDTSRRLASQSMQRRLLWQ